MGKSSSKSSSRKSRNEYQPNQKAFIDTLSLDTTGPLPARDRHDNEYIQLLVLAGTGLRPGKPIKLKSEAPPNIINQVRELEN